ncbi:MAG: hypothetical protein QOI98_2283 [Solirubrobacteraceae bacterium]|jgi:hypothetical protein|nr:hypothetical protein [Solirubrobacteraceae bacterium]
MMATTPRAVMSLLSASTVVSIYDVYILLRIAAGG